MSDELRVRVAEDGAPPERLATLATYLRAELLELDVADVRTFPGDEPPHGARLEIDGDIPELSDATPGDRERLVALFLSRQAVASEQP